MVSEPLAMPEVLKPSTQTVWDVLEIEVGVAEPIVATPPEIESAKSPTSRITGATSRVVDILSKSDRY